MFNRGVPGIHNGRRRNSQLVKTIDNKTTSKLIENREDPF